MRARRYLLLGVAGLLGLLMIAAWLVPLSLDWNRHRAAVAQLASAALGQTVRIDGPITVQVLPQPLLIAGGVSVVEAPGGVQVVASELQLRVALGPLLAGRLDARELVLRGADIRVPWPFDPNALAAQTPVWLAAVSARLQGARLRVGELEFTGINATLATSDLSGSFYSAGRLRTGGRDWVFTARVTRPGGDGAVGVDVTLDGQGIVQGVGVVVSGQTQPDGTMLGRVAVRGPDMAQLMPAPAVPFRAAGRLSIGGGLLAADELQGEIAGSPLQGAIALRLSPLVRLDLALTASRLDLDGWVQALFGAAEGAALGRLPIGLDLSAEAAALAGGTLRAVRGAFDIDGGSVVVRELRATLPGEAQLKLSGRLLPRAEAAARLRFVGQASLAAPALRTTLSWAAAAGLGPFDALPPGVLRHAELAAVVAVDAEQISATDLTGLVDGNPLRASLALRTGARPGLKASLELARLELDPWLPERLPGLAEVLPAIGGFGLDLQMEARSAVLRGVAIAPLVIDVVSEPGRLALRRLEAQALGSSLAGAVTLLEGGRLADGRAELRATEAGRLAALLPAELAALAAQMPGLLRGALLLQVQAAGAQDALGVKLGAELGDIRLEATPTFDLPAGRGAGALTLRHPGAPRLAALFGHEDTAPWLGEGSFALVAQLTGSAERWSAENFSLSAGALRATGSLLLERNAVPRLSGRVLSETLPLPLPDPRAPAPLPMTMLAGWQASLTIQARQVLLGRAAQLDDAAATLTVADGVLRLNGLTARLAGGAVRGLLQLDSAARPPALAVELAVTGAQASGPVLDTAIDITAGGLDLTARMTAIGFSPAALMASLAGQLTLAGHDGILRGVDLARMGQHLAPADLRAALAGGATAFERLTLAAIIDRGLLTLQQAALAGPAGSIAATGSIDLTRAVAALRLALVPAVPEAPEIGLRLTGPVGAPERAAELAAVTRWRAEHVR